ncbi:MAG: acyl-CoA dehydratase activase [Thermodesulfobacteriota bacterium]|nr:acyl-CoA dehydratase activase [Thermodesulfobacteriota bacterium]
MAYLGIDIGSLSCDAVLVDSNETILASSVVPTGARNTEAIARARQDVIQKAGVNAADIKAVISTGYGRNRVDDRYASVTEITCHARGIRHLLPDTRLLIDIGGQDSKAIRMDADGRVQDFAMNDKCAAGTGRFLEAMARALEVDIDELGDLDAGAQENLFLSSVCTVFAESEVVSLIADGKPVNEIANGLNRSIAARTLSLVKRIGGEDLSGMPVAMSGGVAHNAGVVRALSAALNTPLHVPENPDIVGALGAALIGRERSV